MQTISIVFSMILILTGAAYCAILDLEKNYLKDKLFSSRTHYVVLIAGMCLLGGFSAFMVCGKAVSYFTVAKTLIAYVLVSMAAIYDFKTKKIPNYIPLVLSCISIVILVLEYLIVKDTQMYIISSVFGALSSMAVLYVASKLSHGGVGFGDVKLFGAIGLCIGFYGVFATMLLSLLACALFAVPVMAVKTKSLRGDLPFAPFIYIAYSFVLILSQY